MMMISVMWEVWEHRLLTPITQNKEKKNTKNKEQRISTTVWEESETELEKKLYLVAVSEQSRQEREEFYLSLEGDPDGGL